MKEKERPLKKHLFQRHNGFVSTYFLSMLLYITSVIVIVIQNISYRMETCMNMEKALERQAKDMHVISDVKCHLLNKDLENGSYEVNGISYAIEKNAGIIYVTTSYDEITITFSEESNKILDYTLENTE